LPSAKWLLCGAVSLFVAKIQQIIVIYPPRWVKNVNIIDRNQHVVSALIVGKILAMCIVIAMMVVGVGQKK